MAVVMGGARYRVEFGSLESADFRGWIGPNDSVGTDGRDDGGSVAPENEDEPYQTLFNGEDWVWPRKAR